MHLEPLTGRACETNSRRSSGAPDDTVALDSNLVLLLLSGWFHTQDCNRWNGPWSWCIKTIHASLKSWSQIADCRCGSGCGSGFSSVLFESRNPQKNISSRGVEWVFNGFSNEGFHEFQAFWSVPGQPAAPVGRGFSAVPQVFQLKSNTKWSFGWFLDANLENGYFKTDISMAVISFFL